jgi:hypothetical protein
MKRAVIARDFYPVIASEAKQSRISRDALDCFALLAMTMFLMLVPSFAFATAPPPLINLPDDHGDHQIEGSWLKRSIEWAMKRTAVKPLFVKD